MKSGLISVVFITVLLNVTMVLTTPSCCAQPQEQQAVIGLPAIDTGIPTVTPEQTLDKFKRIVLSIHDMAVKISPYLTLLIIVIGGILGVLIQSARAAILWAIIAMLLILWAPEIVGFIEYLKTV